MHQSFVIQYQLSQDHQRRKALVLALNVAQAVEKLYDVVGAEAAQNDQVPEFEFLECVPFDGIIID